MTKELKMGGTQIFYGGVNAGREVNSRAKPEEWIPLLMNAYRALREILEEFKVKPVIVGAGAYGIHVEFDPTKDIDIALSKPLLVSELGTILNRLSNSLKTLGYRVLGGGLQQGRSPEDWVIQIFIGVKPGRIVGLEIFNLLNARPLSVFETKTTYLEGEMFEVLTLESWITSKLTDPNGIDERNLRRLEKSLEKNVNVEKILEIVMRSGLSEIAKINAKDALARTRHAKLKTLLTVLI